VKFVSVEITKIPNFIKWAGRPVVKPLDYNVAVYF
jgi:hypothetical protein